LVLVAISRFERIETHLTVVHQRHAALGQGGKLVVSRAYFGAVLRREVAFGALLTVTLALELEEGLGIERLRVRATAADVTGRWRRAESAERKYETKPKSAMTSERTHGSTS
jgi:hypothetical protein